MHRAKTSSLPKFLSLILSIFLVTVMVSSIGSTPAEAASIQGCQSANAGSQAAISCQSNPDFAVSLAPQTHSVSETGLVAGAVISQSTMVNVTTQLTATECSAAGGITFSIGAATSSLGNSWVVSINPSSGAISFSGGTAPNAATVGTYVYQVTGNCYISDYVITKTANFTLTVTSTALSITPSSQTMNGVTGSQITSSASLTASNFGGAVTYMIAPSLPSGLTISPSTGVVSGTPTSTQAAVTYTITGSYNAQSATSSVTITVTAPAPVNAPIAEPEPPSRKVTICHRTHSETNPYVRITVDYNSVNKKSGHQGHDEIFAGQHVFTAGIYKRAKDKLWGDIIPADPSGLNRWQPLNWTTLGAQIYSGAVAGCPGYDPVAYYNAQREAGVPEKKLKAEMAEIEAELKEGNPGTSRVDPTTLKYSGKDPVVAEKDNDKVTICHRTNSVTNPYVRITVSTSSITNPAGHYEHDEIYGGHHVFDSTVSYPNNKKDWGDIIPADPTGKNRWQPLNWTALGQSIYNGTTAGCGEQTAQEVYNKLRESGLPKKQVIQELEKQKDVDKDPKEIDELTYKGNDPEVEKKEPKEPALQPNVTTPEQSLSGIIWLDRNKDGMKDPDEPYLPNVELTILQSDGKLVATVKTDANGFFQATSLTPGDYKVVTKIPKDLEVTYDSEGLHQGEMNVNLPSGGKTFTYAGLVGTSEIADKKILETVLLENPKALPLEEIPTWLKTKVQNLLGAEKFTGKPSASKPTTGKAELAATGSNDLAWLIFGLLLMGAGAFTALFRRKRS